MQTVTEKKAQLRILCKELRTGMSPGLREKADADIFCSTWELVRRLGRQELFVYVSSPGLEVDTIRLIDTALSGGLRVIVPRCVRNAVALEHFEITSRSQLQKGSFGILEPDITRCPRVSPEYSGVCIVPGLAFDERGCRMGYGKGYYDRFLCMFDGVKIGLCYESCFFEEIPSEEHDAVMDHVITEKCLRSLHHGKMLVS